MDLERIESVLKEAVINLGYDFVSLSMSSSKGERILTLTIDRVEPISMNDILKVNDVVNPLLDELIPEEESSFNFEVTSLGIEKELSLSNLASYIGRYVEVRMDHPIDGENILQGDLKEDNGDNIVITIRIKTRFKDIRIEKSNILKIRLAIKF